MENLVFMGRHNDVRAAVSSPDIRLRPCLLSVRCSRLNTLETDLTVLVKVCVCVHVHASTHVFTHTHTDCRVKLQSSESPGQSLT